VHNRLAAVLLFLALAACSRKPEAVPAPRHYSLSGRVLSLNAKDRTATIDAAAMPGFMEAMTMEYPIKSSSDFDKLHIGDKIFATVEVRDDGLYDLIDVRKQSSGTAP
jgi:Cu/Ag efflux protein CusF